MPTYAGPSSVCMASTATVKSVVAMLLHYGFQADADYRLGTVTVKDGDQVAYRALQKGKGQPWIVSAYNTEHLTWGQPHAAN